MGYINRLSCRCGYHTRLWLGGGRALPDEEYIKKNFSEEKLAEFKEALDSGALGPLFYLENVLSYCENCKELKEGLSLHYQVNSEEKTVYDFCPSCGGELRQIIDPPLCPKCGKVMDSTMEGFWD